MIYLRPIPDPVHKKNHTLIVTKTTDFQITDKATSKTITTPISVVEMNTGLDKEGYMHAKTPAVIPTEVVETIYRHLEFKMVCAHYGEVINERLLSFLIQYYPTKMNELLKKDFMQLRNDLSDILKSDERLYTIERLNTSRSRKTFRQLFAQFIEDRNIYTHGSFVYRTNDDKLLVHFIDKQSGKYTYSVVNSDIMQSFEELYHFLKSILAELRELVGKLDKEKRNSPS